MQVNTFLKRNSNNVKRNNTTNQILPMKLPVTYFFCIIILTKIDNRKQIAFILI